MSNKSINKSFCKNVSYKEKCNSCKLADHDKETMSKYSNVIDLNCTWTLNHYSGKEGFLGWLVLQPKRHVENIEDLNDDELCSLGPNIKDITNASIKHWDKKYHNDKLLRVYAIYFNESVLEKDEKWHLHMHLICRPASFSKHFGYHKKEKSFDAWLIYKINKFKKFPPKYRLEWEEIGNSKQHRFNHKSKIKTDKLLSSLEKIIKQGTKSKIN